MHPNILSLHQDDIDDASKGGDGPGSGQECPICVMFKEGGCKEQFDVS